MRGPVPSGALDTYVQFLRYAETGRSELNEVEGEWAALEAAWAKRLDVSDGEKIAAGDSPEARICRLLLRRTPVLAGLTSADMVRIGADDWGIIGVRQAGETWDAQIEVRAEFRPKEAV